MLVADLWSHAVHLVLHGAVQGRPQLAVVAVLVVDEAENALVEGIDVILD